MSVPSSDAAAMAAAARRQPQPTPVADLATQARGLASNQPRGASLPASVAATVLAPGATQGILSHTVHVPRQPVPPALTQPQRFAQVASNSPATFTQLPLGHAAVQPSPVHAVRPGRVGDDPSSRAPSAPVPESQTGYALQSSPTRYPTTPVRSTPAYTTPATQSAPMPTNQAPVQTVRSGHVGDDPSSRAPSAPVPNAQTGLPPRQASARVSAAASLPRWHTDSRAPTGTTQLSFQYAATSFPASSDQAAASAALNQADRRYGGIVAAPPYTYNEALGNTARTAEQISSVTLDPAPTARRQVSYSTTYATRSRGFRRFFTTIFWTSLALVILAFIGAAFSKRSH